MKKLNILFPLMLVAYVVGFSQTGGRPPLFAAQEGQPQARGGNSNCQKDSTLIFDYQMPVSPDQIEERVIYTYGNSSEVAVRFRRDIDGPLLLSSVDSTVFNADHQPIFIQTRGANFVSGTYLIGEFFTSPARSLAIVLPT